MYLYLIYRAREGLKLLADTENQWKPRASLVTHVNWHRALFHVQLGEFEQALTLWDDVIVKDATKCKCMKYITYISSKIELYSCIQFNFLYSIFFSISES